jgi:purine-binding chemotaxis protein CheW
VADRVLEVVNIADDQIEGAPDVGVAWRSDYIAGVVRRDSGFVVLFNLSKLLTADTAILASSAAKAA